MTPEDIVKEIKEKWSEYLEMSENPGDLMAWVLANKIIELKEEIKYLNRRVKHVCNS